VDLQAELERLALEKKAGEASDAEHEAADVHNYMMKDAKEHAMDMMNSDSQGSVDRFKRIMKVMPGK